MRISEIFKRDYILADLKCRTKEDLLTELIAHLGQREPINEKEVYATLWVREKMLTTVISPGIALPHTQVANIGKAMGVIGICHDGVDYQSMEGKPVHLIFLLVDDAKDSLNHMIILRDIALLIRNPQFYSRMIKCTTSEEAYKTLLDFEEMELKPCSGSHIDNRK